MSDGSVIYWDGHLVSCVMSNHWVVYLKPIQYCMSTVIEKLKVIKKIITVLTVFYNLHLIVIFC